ncbi:universal stress protein [Desulfallas sp. Bu1-1]|uniref:universal stress protein n=1 Tax=Desulfallas sp. Bu1-1 TaxID=2787620 RepID=UPI00189D949B|nr:universal stress protein [Desulfallas sp. Bu1-1]MBF7082539.1 universal stress protein [Desulfallas sp. Bu1-1]
MVQKILLAVDGSENALRAAGFALDLVKSIPGARCTAITVVSFTREEARYLGVPDADFYAALEMKASRLLEGTEELFGREGVALDRVVLQGDVARSIAGYAGENRYDLIVMGTRGHGNIKGMLLGSVSSKVIQIAHCPVVTVK